MSSDPRAAWTCDGDLAGALARRSERSWLRRTLEDGPLEIRARGVSMRPLLQPGDRIRIERRTGHPGDVALVALPERLVLHRLMRRRGDRWLVRGDARGAPDGWIHTGQILGIATARLRENVRRPRWQRLDVPPRRLAGLALPPALRASRALWRALAPLRGGGTGRALRRSP